MNVGIYTRWQRRDSTYAAIQIAELFSQWQHEVTILTPTPTKPAVSGFWDGRVHHDTQVRFIDWAAPLAVVIWLFCPAPAQPGWAASTGKRTVLVPDWADLDAIEEHGHLFWRIMAPTRSWVRFFDKYDFRNVLPCPWSPMLPITERAPVEPVRVYVPPANRPCDRDDNVAVDVIEAMLTLNSFVQATIAMDGRRSTTVKRLERMAKAEPRLILARPADYHQQVLRYSEHSLTLLPTVVENFSMSALCSLHMGTPIVGFNVPARAEVTSPQNSVLVDCAATDYLPNESETLVPEDRFDLLNALMTLVEQPGLSRLFSGCSVGLARRRQEFAAAWSTVIARRT